MQKLAIKGMTCSACKYSVAHYLKQHPQVNAVEVDLVNNTAEIDANVAIDELQSLLPEKYSVELYQNRVIKSVQPKSKLAQLKPLLLIFLYITTAVVLIDRNKGIHAMMIDFMGLFFIVFSFFKLLDLKAFPDSFAMYDPLAAKVNIYGWIYPFIETALGLMFLFRFQLLIAVSITLILLSITTFGVGRSILDKQKIQCACLGTALKLPMTEATIIENVIMIGMGLCMLRMLL